MSSGRNGKINGSISFPCTKFFFLKFSSRYEWATICYLNSFDEYQGGANAAGGSKAAFSMFQQKDVAAGGTGKVSR
jgi:hypothetical protein